MIVKGGGRSDLRFEHLVISGSLGISLVLAVAANALHIGSSWSLAIWLVFVIWLVSVLLVSTNRRFVNERRLLVQIRSILKPLGLINFFVGVSAVLLTFSKPDNAMIGLRLGVDFALYTDASQLLLERPSLALPELVESSSTSFGPAAFVTHIRWGAPILVAFSSWVTQQSHSYQILIPLLASCVGLLAAVTTVLARSTGLNKTVATLSGLLVVFNAQVISLALEGSLPQVIFLPLFVTVLFELREFQAVSFRHCARISIELSLLLASCALVYSEFLPIILMLLLIATFLEAFRRGWSTANSVFLKLGLTLTLTILLILPHSIALLKHLMNLTTQGVGYPIPHLILPSEVVGLGSVWTRWTDWMTPAAMPKLLSRENLNYDILFALFVTIFLVAGGLRILRTCPNWRIWVASGLVVAPMAFQFIVNNRNSYLWMKSIVSFIPLLVVSLLLGVCSVKILRGVVAHTLIALILIAVGVTASRGITSFRESSRPLFVNVFEVRDYLKSRPSCALLFRPRGLTSGGESQSLWWHASQKRNVDRVHDFAMVSIFRENPILDSWSGEPIGSRSRDLDDTLPVCIAFEVNVDAYGSASVFERYSDVFRNEHWIVSSAGLSVRELRSNGIDTFYKEFFEPTMP